MSSKRRRPSSSSLRTLRSSMCRPTILRWSMAPGGILRTRPTITTRPDGCRARRCSPLEWVLRLAQPGVMRGAAVTGDAGMSMWTSTGIRTSIITLIGASIRTRYQPAKGVGASGSTIRSTAREYPTGTRGRLRSSTGQPPGMLSHGKLSAAVPRQEGRILPVAVRTNTVTVQQADGRT